MFLKKIYNVFKKFAKNLKGKRKIDTIEAISEAMNLKNRNMNGLRSRK